MKPIIGHISKNQVRFIRSLQQKKIRDEERLFVAEGDKCISELLGHFDLVYLVESVECTPVGLVESSLKVESEKVKKLLASPQELSQMSSLKTPQGPLAVFRQKSDKLSTIGLDGFSKLSTLNSQLRAQALTLALDGIQDPGNLGTIIRTADWFGISDIYCSHDTADCYNPKVVQATMGALARVRVYYIDLVNWLSEISGISGLSGTSGISGTSSPIGGGLVGAFPVYGTLLDGKNIYEPGAIPDSSRGIIVMGNEGNGISAEVRKLITHPLYIPSYANPATAGSEGLCVESLNVAIATAITLAEFRRLSQQK